MSATISTLLLFFALSASKRISVLLVIYPLARVEQLSSSTHHATHTKQNRQKYHKQKSFLYLHLRLPLAFFKIPFLYIEKLKEINVVSLIQGIFVSGVFVVTLYRNKLYSLCSINFVHRKLQEISLHYV